MNLAYPIEDIAEIDGIKYKLDMSFDNILRLFDLIKDEKINDEEKINTGLMMLVNDELEQYDIETKEKIFIDLFKSAIGSEEEEHQTLDLEGNPMPDIPNDDKRAYDLVQDAEYIYASFMHTYQIDLYEQQGKLHWKKFKALLNGLSEDSIFSRIVGIRTAELPTGKGMQKERERLRKLKKQYALEDDNDEET
ncbi:Gp15 family bacteriophage protein [Pueribacillus sp. YX66]|uniref:Gp15 family bacteriophage protein n=1 Tax=Pueribacillus sp. YX66 TaxID=3229242 RepID=UPI00358CDDDD